MRRLVAVLVLATAMVVTVASSALASGSVPCIFGCISPYSIVNTESR